MPLWTSRIGAGLRPISAIRSARSSAWRGVDALVRQHRAVLGPRGPPRDVEGADEAADGHAAGGVLVQVERGCVVATERGRAPASAPAGRRRRGRGGRTHAPVDGSPTRCGASIRPGNGRSRNGPATYGGVTTCPASIRASYGGNAMADLRGWPRVGRIDRSPDRRLRPGDARPRRRRLRGSRRGPGCAEHLRRDPGDRDADGVHHQQRGAAARRRWPRT